MKNIIKFIYILGLLLVTQNHFQCTHKMMPLPNLDTMAIAATCDEDSSLLYDARMMQHYGFRIITPEIGRFVSVDTLSKGIISYNYIKGLE